mgnify:CR=1 FL=1
MQPKRTAAASALTTGNAVAPAVAGGEGGHPVYAASVVPQQGAQPVYAATVVPQPPGPINHWDPVYQRNWGSLALQSKHS